MPVVVRRWYVVAIGLAFTAGAVVVEQHQPPIYWSRVTVVVLQPSGYSPNVLTTQGPIAVAGVAVMDVTGRPLDLRASSSDATLYGLGVTSGTWIRLRNEGGQWAPSANSPYIDIDAVDSTPAEVTARIDTAVAQVRRAIEARERALRLSPRNWSGVQETPGAALVQPVPDSRARALLTTLVAGAGWTAAAVGAIEAAGRRRRRRVPPSRFAHPGRPVRADVQA